jgi:putative ATP-dependent DNA ligase
MKSFQEHFDEEFIKIASKALGMPESKITGMIKRRVLQRISMFLPEYYRFEKGISGVEPGTILFNLVSDIEIVKGFPKIHRAMVLEPTIQTHFKGLPLVAIEEKMNGYNVRIVKIQDQVIALTRGGLVCPYTTEKAIEEIGPEFFRDNPGLVLCGEMVGPDNPYVPKDIYPEVESIALYVFDIREKNTGRSVTLVKKNELCGRYGIKTVRHFGNYPADSVARVVTDLIRELGASGHEGVVIKDPVMNLPALKYTCSESTNSDLRYAFEFYNDYGRDFFFSRVVREGFQSVEWDENGDALYERSCRLGESILKPMVETIRKRKRGERITENVRIRVSSIKTAQQFEEHLRLLGIDAQFSEPIYVDGQYLVEIKKFNHSTNDRTEALLNGQFW